METSNTASGEGALQRSSRETVLPLEFHWLREIEFDRAWTMQQSLTSLRRTSPLSMDTVLLLTHPSVYTAGRLTQESDLPSDGSPVVSVNRGGRVTWHGPGQLVGYPIIKLATPLDVGLFLRQTEEALIRTVSEWGVTAGRVPGRAGVWLPSDAAVGKKGNRPERKIAALGYHLTHGISQHGFAINCNNSLEPFERIVPCGIADAGVTTLSRECGTRVTPEDVRPVIEHYFALAMDGDLPLSDSVIPR